MRELSVAEQRYQAVMAVIGDAMGRHDPRPRHQHRLAALTAELFQTDLAKLDAFEQRLHREVRNVGRLHEAHVVPIHHGGEALVHFLVRGLVDQAFIVAGVGS